MAKADVPCAFKNLHVSDVDVSHNPYVRFSYVAHKNIDGLKLFL